VHAFSVGLCAASALLALNSTVMAACNWH